MSACAAVALLDARPQTDHQVGTTDRADIMRISIDHPTDRPNFTEVEIGDVTVWFSYRTPVAFMAPGRGRVVRENDWGPTTGKHLCYVDGGDKPAKSRRLESDAFMAALETVLAPIGVKV